MTSRVLHLNKEDFEKIVEGSKDPVLVDFWAPWCGPCRQLTPELEAVAEEVDGKATVAKINVDEETELAGRFGVFSIPTIIVLKDGKQINKMVGFRNRNELKKAMFNGSGVN